MFPVTKKAAGPETAAFYCGEEIEGSGQESADQQIKHGGHTGGSGAKDEAFEADFVEFGIGLHEAG